MSNFTDFISGGGDAAPIPTAQFVIGESKTFTAPLTGRIKVILTGGGGQGAFLANKNATPNVNSGDATGGGAGGYSEKIFNVTAGETFTVTIGAGGATTLAMNDINSSRVGNNGGNSSFVTASAAESVNMVANGGGGGQYSAATSSAVTTAGGAGGTASGGDFNYTGGAGGSITRVANNANNAMTTGGGAVALYGTTYRGGNITLGTANASSGMIGATGGAGVGGNGGDIAFSGTGANARFSSGGSATRSGPSGESGSSLSPSSILGNTAGGPTSSPTINIIDAQGFAYGGKYAYNESLYVSTSQYGAGGGGGTGYNQSGNVYRYFYAGDAGGFGGGGSVTYISGVDLNSTNPARAGRGGTGGGGGGAFSGPFHTMTAASGREWVPGGDGMCIIMFI